MKLKVLKQNTTISYTSDIEPNGKVTITVTFNSDHKYFENCFDFILNDVPNQKVENKILVTA